MVRERHPRSDRNLEPAAPARAKEGLVALVACAILLCGFSRPVTAGAELSLTAGLGQISFRDGHLADLYGSPLAPVLGVRAGTFYGFSPTIAFCLGKAGHVPPSRGFVEQAKTSMMFLPAALQLPYEYRLSSRWGIRAGVQIAYAWFREEWEATAPSAGFETRHHGTGGWFGAGVLGEVWIDLGRVGAVEVGLESLWAGADRKNIGGNPNTEEEMTGGWSLIRMSWSPPWPTRR